MVSETRCLGADAPELAGILLKLGAGSQVQSQDVGQSRDASSTYGEAGNWTLSVLGPR